MVNKDFHKTRFCVFQQLDNWQSHGPRLYTCTCATTSHANRMKFCFSFGLVLSHVLSSPQSYSVGAYRLTAKYKRKLNI